MNILRSIKKNLSDPKKRSLTLLIIYILFFIFVFVVLNSSSNSSTNNDAETHTLSIFDNYKNMNSYQYKIIYTTNNTVDIVEGTYYNKTSLLKFNNNRYYLENDLLYIIDNDYYYLSSIQYNINKLLNTNFYNIISSAKEESSTTFTDGVKKTNYKVNSNEFYNYYFDLDSAYEGSIDISTTSKDNYITNISIDLTNLNIDLTNIQIEYSNINNINSLEFNKENLIYRE